MSGDKKIYITVSSEEVELLKEEIKDYIIDTVDKVLAEKNLIDQNVKRRNELNELVHTTFENGTNSNFSTGSTDRNNSTPQEFKCTVRDVCEGKKDGKWVNSVAVKVVDVDPTYDQAHRLLQRGVMVDLSNQWKFSFVIWRNSGLEKLEIGEHYRLKDIISSVYGDQVEMQLNSKSEVYGMDYALEMAMDQMDLIG